MPAPIVNTPGTKPTDKVVLVIREMEAWALTIGVRFTLFYGSTIWPDHNTRRCFDAMTASAVDAKTGKRLTAAQSMAFGTKLNAYIRSRAKAWGLNGVIWNYGVWGFPHDTKTGHAYRGPVNVRRKYTQPNHHIDHNHGEVDGETPYVPPSWLVKAAEAVKAKLYPTPKDHEVYVVKLDPGQADSDSVYWAQFALNAVLDGPDIKTTGTYDADTVTAVKRFQKSLGDDVDGDLGPLQTAKLFELAKIKVEIR